MKYLTNIYDPKQKDAKAHLIRMTSETVEQAWASQSDYLKDKVIDRPHATDRYSVEELEAMHLVGVYLPDEEDHPA